MENIIFCGKCGAFIPSKELTSGKVLKANNVFYCTKCSAESIQRAQPRAPGVPASQAGAPRPPIRPVSRPVPTQQPVVQPQRPVIQRQQPAAQPIAPSQPIIRRAPIQQPPRATPVQRPVVQTPPIRRIAPVSRSGIPLSPVPVRDPIRGTGTIKTRLPHAEPPPVVEPRRSHLYQKPPKKGINKIYLIAGAVVVVIVIVIAVWSSLAKQAANKRETERLDLAKNYYREIEASDKDFEEDPQQVLDKIKSKLEFLANTEYEQKVKTVEKRALERLDILEKKKELDANPAEKLDEIEAKRKEYSDLRLRAQSYPKIYKAIDDIVILLKKKAVKIKEEEEARLKQEEEELQKTYDEFKAKTTELKGKQAYKDIIKACDEVLLKPGMLKYQEEVNEIKANAEEGLKEQKTAEEKRKDWQVLSEDQSRWTRQGSSGTEFYVDGDNCMVMKNPLGGSQTVLISNNNWQNFTMVIEFKVLNGALDMQLRGGIAVPFPRKFGSPDEWRSFTIRLEKSILTVTEKGKDPKTAEVRNQAGPIMIIVKPGDHIIIKLLKVKVIE